MGQKKLERFAALKSFSNVLQNPENTAGNWKKILKNDHPIVLELACGKGEYSVGLGRKNPDINYIGVDIKGNRMYRGAKTALAEKLENVHFLRCRIEQIDSYFAPNEVSEIWILFPDPFLRKPKEKNRLTHARFLYLYQKILQPGGIIHLKTDSKELYEFTLGTINIQGCKIQENIADIYGKGKVAGALAIQTFYEQMHLAEGKKIYYLSFKLPEKTIDIPERFLRSSLGPNP
jgi:tRNA (guanine-N7-)-methyltransferase